MGVGFVQQQDGAAPGSEKRQQHQDLLESAAGAGHVEPRPLIGHGVFRADVRAAGVGRQQPIAEQLADGCLQRLPCRLLAVRLGQQVAEHLARAPDAEKLFDLGGLQHRFVGAEAGHRRHEHHLRIDPAQVAGRGTRRSHVDLFAAVGDQLHRHRPAGVMTQLDLDLPAVAAVGPQQVEVAHRHGRERLAGKRRPPVAVAAIVVVELAPAAQGERPCRDRLQQRGLAGVVGPGQHDVPRQPELDLAEPLEAADANRPDHGSDTARGWVPMSGRSSAPASGCR